MQQIFSPNLLHQGALNRPLSLRQERHLKDMINEKSMKMRGPKIHWFPIKMSKF